MRILFIGDVVAKSGRRILSENLKSIRENLGIDFVIVNAENAAGGNGITKNIAETMFRYGIDAITLGDHTWDQRCFENEIDSIENLCRPANIPSGNPGRDYVILEKDGVKLAVFSLLGQTLMKIKSDCPFAAADRMIEKLTPISDLIFLDFHAETTSEKVSMAWHLDGRAQAVIGTHTHIPTNDARIFPQGLAFQTDAGMTGPWNSCLGREWGNILKRFIDGRPHQFLVAEGDDRICGTIIDIDAQTKKATFIEAFTYPKFNNKLDVNALTQEETPTTQS
ncbi:MAG: TIGR00282 family metallophosphoesterase [Verrucomicrobiaceae bacterium]|nr:TIGR00282 family metallophosphoesterase [Verrucomicrobiaceae bacterium]